MPQDQIEMSEGTRRSLIGGAGLGDASLLIDAVTERGGQPEAQNDEVEIGCGETGHRLA